MELSPHQTQRLEEILAWYKQKDSSVFVLGGLAGTGKTTLISQLLNADNVNKLTGELNTIVVSAFTGKAVNTLIEKGVTNAVTLHKLLYVTRAIKDKDGNVIDMVHEPKGKIPEISMIIVDEASMVDNEIYDLLTMHSKHGIKVLLVGDIGQLPPVSNDPKIMQKPNSVLKEIHRQALESDIIRFAHFIREGNRVRDFEKNNAGEVYIKHPTLDELATADQVLCGFNKTRVRINTSLREEKYGADPDLIEMGDKLVCLMNSKKYRVYNGTLGTVHLIHKVDEKRDMAVLDMEVNGVIIKEVKMSLKCFNNKKGLQPKDFVKGKTHWDYGYCLTTHKSQGSEWDKVVVIEEQYAEYWEAKRWNYTAVTRAKKKLMFAPGSSW